MPTVQPDWALRSVRLPLHSRRQSPRPSPVPSLSLEAPHAVLPAALGGYAFPPATLLSCLGVDLHVRVCVVLSTPMLLHVAVMCFYTEHPVFGHVCPTHLRVDGVRLGPRGRELPWTRVHTLLSRASPVGMGGVRTALSQSARLSRRPARCCCCPTVSVRGWGRPCHATV